MTCLRAPYVLCAIAFTLLAGAASAATSPPGVNLRWDQCYGDGGVWNKSFACDTNTGSDRMVASFELASDFPEPVAGLEVTMDLASTISLPAWWQVKNIGSCRQNSLVASPLLPPGSVNCVDWANGQALGGISAYNIGAFGFGPKYVHMVMAFAVPASALATLHAGQEYFAFQVVINHAKTVGAGSCAGCSVPAVTFFSSLRITTSTPSSEMLLTRAANWSGSQYVSWQNGYPIDVIHDCGMHTGLFSCAFPYTKFNVVPYDVTNARPSTWGQVKSLYR